MNTTCWKLKITSKAKGLKPPRNSSTRSFGGQGRMESVHAQGHVQCQDAHFDPGHVVERESPHVRGEETHDLGCAHQNRNANQLGWHRVQQPSQQVERLGRPQQIQHDQICEVLRSINFGHRVLDVVSGGPKLSTIELRGGGKIGGEFTN